MKEVENSRVCEQAQQTSETPTARKAYHRPTLVEYGPVSRLTRGGSGAGTEGMSGKRGMN